MQSPNTCISVAAWKGVSLHGTHFVVTYPIHELLALDSCSLGTALRSLLLHPAPPSRMLL